MGLSKQIKNVSGDTADHRDILGKKNLKKSGMRVIFAGGGTGGHLFPGIAIAQEFERTGSGSRILFVSSGRAIEESVLAKTHFEKAAIRVEGIKGKGIWSKLKSVFILPKGLAGAVGLLWRFKPDVVIGMGGYSAGPLIVAAWMLRIPRAICEQNKLPGVTNRLLAHFSDRIYVYYKDTDLKASLDKIRVLGNPVRREIVERLQTAGEKQNGADAGRKFVVLILGGSQGAHGINMAVIDALGHLRDPEKYKFIHQSGEVDAEAVRNAYEKRKITNTTAAFFDDMAGLYQEADLVICRSGATTVAEVTIAGCAVIFIPFPHATDNHQVFNAKPLVDEGAAEMILESQISGKLLSERIEFYAGHPDLCSQMKGKIRKFGKPDAAERIVEDIYQLLRKKTRREMSDMAQNSVVL